MRTALRAEGYRVSRDQFRRWQQAGILEPPIAKRRGRGRAAGWEAARFSRTVLERLRIIARVSGLRSDRVSALRIPIGHSAWALWRSGHSVSEQILRAALVRVATRFDKIRTRIGRADSMLVEHAINHSSGAISSPLLREVRRTVNKPGRYPINRYGNLAVLIAKLGEGEFGSLRPSDRKAVDQLFHSTHWESAFRSFAVTWASVKFREIAETATLDLLGAAATLSELLPRIFDETAHLAPLVAALSKYATQPDIESQMLLTLIIVPLFPELLHAAEVARTNQ
jgi:hypothetical protein